jgi:hypothetical protein
VRVLVDDNANVLRFETGVDRGLFVEGILQQRDRLLRIGGEDGMVERKGEVRLFAVDGPQPDPPRSGGTAR